MSTSAGPLRLAARDVDPLSWFTGPYVPLIFASVIALYGLTMTFALGSTGPTTLLRLSAAALCASACVLVQVFTLLRRRFDDLLGVIAVSIGGAGLIVASFAYSGSSLALELWWAPVGFALVLASIVPYLAAWRIVLYGTLALVTVVPVAFAIVVPSVDRWGPVSTFMIIATPTIVSVAAGAAFSMSVVRQVLPVIDNRSTGFVSEALAVHPDDEEAERVSLARYTARAAPFLRMIAERGTVEPDDRVVAGEIARYLRDDLVSRSDLAWLGLPADDWRVIVIDPDHRADTLRSAQRAAIRDLVRAVLDAPATIESSLLIELRAEDDGSTAVAMSLDTQLPEGRRVRHLAPYYFNLRGQMRDVKLRREGVSFRVPPLAD